MWLHTVVTTYNFTSFPAEMGGGIRCVVFYFCYLLHAEREILECRRRRRRGTTKRQIKRFN